MSKMIKKKFKGLLYSTDNEKSQDEGEKNEEHENIPVDAGIVCDSEKSSSTSKPLCSTF